MIIDSSNSKQLIDFLLLRWQNIIGLAALERIYKASCLFAKEHNQPMPVSPPTIISKPCRQIEIIKHHIIEILPEADIIDYEYEAPAPLNYNDFLEVFTADHRQCINKVRAIAKNKID